MKRTIVVVADRESDNILTVLAEADNLADAKRVMKQLPDGVYDILSFQEYGVEVSPAKREITRVVRPGKPAVSRARRPGTARKRSAARLTA